MKHSMFYDSSTLVEPSGYWRMIQQFEYRFQQAGESAVWLVRWLQHKCLVLKYSYFIKTKNNEFIKKSGFVSQPNEKPMNEFVPPTLIR